MYTREEIINIVKNGLNERVVTKEDFGFINGSEVEKPKRAIFENLANMFYVLGGLIILLGIIILTGMFWTDMGQILRLLLTIGVGIFTYTYGIILKSKNWRILSQVSFAVSAFLIPFGIHLIITDMGVNIEPSILADLLMIPLLFGGYYGGVYLQSRTLLINSAIFTMAYIVKNDCFIFHKCARMASRFDSHRNIYYRNRGINI